MRRRILTARDQVAMLAPWREASYADTPEEERGDWDEDDWDQYHAEMELRKTPTNGNHPVVDQIHNEFNDWWENGGTPGNEWSAGPDEDGVDRGPIGHWPTVENFLKERYPAAYRGLGYGYEEAKAVLDNEGEIHRAHPESYRGESDPAKQPKPYETGNDAVAKYGYDPREIASAAMYLHNLSRGIESFSATSWEDDGRLYDIARKRHQMQRNYENRQSS